MVSVKKVHPFLKKINEQSLLKCKLRLLHKNRKTKDVTINSRGQSVQCNYYVNWQIKHKLYSFSVFYFSMVSVKKVHPFLKKLTNKAY